jgi:FkbM family methyltransferase
MTRFYLGQLPFYVRPGDWFAFEEIVLLQEYHFITTPFQAGVPEIIIDLGANVGLFSLYALSRWPSAQVHSLEASPDTYPVLCHNQRANPGLHWRTYQYAVWEQGGEVGFKDGGVSTSRRVVLGQAEKKVPAITLDTFCATYIHHPKVSLVKMDIEGAEEVVLQSSARSLGRIENLVIEVHPEHCDQDHVVWLLRSSFEYLYQTADRLSGKPMLLACRRRQSLPLCYL